MNKIYPSAITINCDIGENVVIGEDSFLRNSSLGNYVQINRRNILEETHVGDYTYTGANTVLKHINIGRFCAISWNVSATGNFHDYNKMSTHPFTNFKSFGFVMKDSQLEHKKIEIGNDVWIGANACVLGGVTIGDGAVIGGGR